MAQLYSVKQGQEAEFDLSVDQNGEIVATCGDEFLKFPAGLTKAQLLKAFQAHNDANEGRVGLTEEEIAEENKVAEASQKLIDSL